MMKVVLSDIVQPLFHGSDLSRDDTLHGNVYHVVDEDSKDQQRIAERYDWTGIRPVALHRQTRQRESDERRSAIAQKNDGWFGSSIIIRQKPKPCSNHGHGKPPQFRLMRFKCDDAHKPRHENHEPG